jgi:hypothetical protein
MSHTKSFTPNRADPYHMNKVEKRMVSRMMAGRWNGIGDQAARDSIALHNASSVGSSEANQYGAVVGTTSQSLSSLYQEYKKDNEILDEEIYHNVVLTSADEKREQQLAKRRERDRARRASLKLAKEG